MMKKIKEIENKCREDKWYYPKRAFALALWVFTIMAVFDSFAMNASAETGSITLSNDSNVNFSIPDSVLLLNANSLAGFSQSFLFDYRNYTTLTNMTILDPDNRLVFSQPNEVTTFTITVNGSGHGVASYSEFLHQMTWVFSGDTVITGTPFNVSYSNNIFRNVTYGAFPPSGIAFAQGAANIQQARNINNTQPFAMGNLTSAIVGTQSNNLDAGTLRRFIYSGIVSSGTVTTFYNFTYPAESYYLANISKSGQSIQTKYYLHTQTNASYGYFAESSFNTNDSQVLMPQLDGIYLNITLSGGDFVDTLINSSGTSGIVPGPTPNASNPNSPNCNGYNCIITSKPTYNNTESVNVYGSFYPANTTVTSCLFFGFICEDTTINTESDTGYVLISTQGSTSPVKFLSFLKDQNNNYNLYTDLDIGSYQAQLYGFASPGATCQGGIVYDFPYIPLGCYYPHNITNFNVVNRSGNLSIVWQTKMANSSAIYGDTITVAWQNVTANDTVAIYDMNGTLAQFYNINQSSVKQIPVFIPLYTIGTWNATIFNGSNILHNATAYLNVLPPGAVDVNNSYGITMYWSKATDIVNNPTQLNWNTGTYSGNYNISIKLNGEEVQRTPFIGAPGQTQQAMYTFDKAGAYIAEFLNNTNNLQQQATIRIAAGTISTTPSVTNVPSGAEASQDMGDNLISFMAMPAFWGLIIFVLVLWFCAVKAPQAVAICAFITSNIEAVIGLWNPFMWYILVITWVIAGIYFKMSRDTVTGVK